jgi:hypothetical protein
VFYFVTVTTLNSVVIASGSDRRCLVRHLLALVVAHELEADPCAVCLVLLYEEQLRRADHAQPRSAKCEDRASRAQLDDLVDEHIGSSERRNPCVSREDSLLEVLSALVLCHNRCMCLYHLRPTGGPSEASGHVSCLSCELLRQLVACRKKAISDSLLQWSIAATRIIIIIIICGLLRSLRLLHHVCKSFLALSQNSAKH